MSKQLQQEIGALINPLTGNSLLAENRGVTVKKDGDTYKLSYLRDGIDLKHKKEIENSFYKLLGRHGIDEDNIIIMSKSKESGPPVQAPPPQQKEAPEKKASLSTGHGPASPQEKQRIKGVKKIVGIGSGKGGVGKSTLALNLACALVKKGKKVGLIDADIYGPSLPLMLGKKGVRPMAGKKNKIMPTDAEGLKFVSFGQFIGENDPVIWRGPMLGGVLRQFFFDVEWGELDILLVDLPPGTGDIQLSMVQLAQIDGIIIVTTPQEVALADSVKGLKMFEQLKIKILGIVENMSFFICNKCQEKHYIFGQEGGQKKAQELSVNLLGTIPLESSLRDSADNGSPYMACEKFKDSVSWKSYMDIADKVDKMVFKSSGFFKNLFG